MTQKVYLTGHFEYPVYKRNLWLALLDIEEVDPQVKRLDKETELMFQGPTSHLNSFLIVQLELLKVKEHSKPHLEVVDLIYY